MHECCSSQSNCLDSPVFIPSCRDLSACEFLRFVCWKQVLMDREERNLLDDGLKVNIRVYNYPESLIMLKNLKAAYIGNLQHLT